MNKVIKYFIDNNYKTITDTCLQWQDIAEELGLVSADAARLQWSRNKHLLDGKEEKKLPKILVFDIETAPLSAYVWRCWKQNVHPTSGQLRSEWFLLTYAAKWLFENKTISGKLTKQEALNQDDTRLVQEMWELLNEADVVIAHYGKGFDIPMMNGRFLKKGLNPPMPYKLIDTKLHASKQFNLPSNKLDYIGEYLGLGRKIKTDFELWANCLKGDLNALQEMETYNIQDVKLLEDVYLAMRSYIQPHPNLGLYIDDDIECCPACMSEDLNWEGQYFTYANSYDAFRCNSCGSIGRSKKTNKKRSNILKSIPTP